MVLPSACALPSRFPIATHPESCQPEQGAMSAPVLLIYCLDPPPSGTKPTSSPATSYETNRAISNPHDRLWRTSLPPNAMDVAPTTPIAPRSHSHQLRQGQDQRQAEEGVDHGGDEGV
jgi:hypothetical protein